MRTVFKYTGFLVIILLMAVIGAAMTLRTQFGADVVETQINRFGYDENKGGVILTGVSGPLPGTVRADTINISDPQGVWLKIENVRFEANLFALLHKTIDIRVIEAANVRILRKPAYPQSDSPKKSGNGLPSIPHIIIGDINIPEIIIAEEIVGGAPSVLSLQLSGEINDRVVLLEGAARTKEGQPLNAQFHVSVNDVIDIDITLDEAPGGPVALMSGLNPDDGLSGHIRASGDINALTGDIAFKEGDNILAQADITLQSHELRVKGAGQWPLSLKKRLAPLGEGWAVDIAGREEKGKIILSETSAITTNAVTIKAYGAGSWEDKRIDRMHVNTHIVDMNTLVKVAGSTAAVSGAVQSHIKLTGGDERWNIVPHISSKKITLNGKVIDGAMMSANIVVGTDDRLTVTGDVDITAAFEGTPLNTGFNVDVDMHEAIRIDDISLRTPYGNATGQLTYRTDNRKIDALLKTERLSLANFMPDAEISAFVTSAVDVEGDPDALYISVEGDITGIEGLPTQARRFITDTVRLDVRTKIVPSATAALENLRITSGKFTAEGKGAWPLSASAPPSSLALTLRNASYTPIKFSADIVPKNDRISIPSLLLQCGDTRVTGKIALDNTTYLPSGTMQLKSSGADALAMWAGLDNVPVSYRDIASDISFDGSQGVLSIDAITDITAVAAADATVNVENISINAALTDVAALKNIVIKTDISGLRQGKNILLSRISAVSRGSKKDDILSTRHTWKMDGINAGQALLLEGETGVALGDNGTVTVTASTLKGEVVGVPFRLSREGTVILRIFLQQSSVS